MRNRATALGGLMHIPDAYLSPAVCAATFALSSGACAVAVIRAKNTLDERRVPLLGMTAAFIFAAQMINFPVAGGTSGHFLGATLAAVLLGPLNACLVMAIVLAIQCLMFQDGGLTALGANIFNMGVIGTIVAYAVFRLLKFLLPQRRWGLLAAAAGAAWASVVIGSSACAVELALSDKWPLMLALPAMAGVHALIGIGEAIITCTVLSTVLAARSDLADGLRPAWEARK